MKLMSFTDNINETDAACESEAVSEVCLSVCSTLEIWCSHTTHFFRKAQSKPTSLTGAFVGARLKIRWFCREESAKQQTMQEFACESDLGSCLCLSPQQFIEHCLWSSSCVSKKKYLSKNQEFTHEEDHRIVPEQTDFADRALWGARCVDGSILRLSGSAQSCTQNRSCVEGSLW